jgi:IS4 transposase
MVTLEEFIDLEYKPEDDEGKRLKGPKEVVTLRRISYQDKKNWKYEFLTNNLNISAEDVAFLYKKRWGIELLFYDKHIVMQSRSKSHIVNQHFTSQFYTTTLHNNIPYSRHSIWSISI